MDQTSSTNSFTACFENKENFSNCTNKFFKTLKRTFHKCFKKVRITTGNNKKLGNPSIQEKMKLKNELKLFLKNNDCKIARRIAETKLQTVEEAIANEIAINNTNIVKEYLGNIETLEGNFSQLGLWKLKQRLCPLKSDPPMAKYDKTGNKLGLSCAKLSSSWLQVYSASD